ncbi:MAG TPA: UDP-N-acetylglucosamine 2-epimerase (non-hydrolyzing) [Acidobacteriota bacterium]|nr:UDP-N-acetylglucosamine 2-epimerase (non-hydrolyzing) [Acidobacteriota bacterium]
MRVLNIVGARPNYMKIAPVVHELRKRHIPQLLVHTGQHYDTNMFQVFFEELGLPHPDVYLGIGSDTHAKQTARIMIAFEEICQEQKPDLVIVGGDVNSTLAVSLTAAKLDVPVAHVEAGLRSFDRTMPEELNRILTDHLSRFLFTTEDSANVNLQKEGISRDQIHYVGNCMVDTLLKHVETALEKTPWQSYKLLPGRYALLTLHRPSNVDDQETLESLMGTISELANAMPVLFPVHPRTRSRLERMKNRLNPKVIVTEPEPYLTFLGLMAKARYVLTDSGGIQEETTILGVPCLTLRENTERPVTISSGTNVLVGRDAEKIRSEVSHILNGYQRKGERPPLWDGKTSIRLVDVIEAWLSDKS